MGNEDRCNELRALVRAPTFALGAAVVDITGRTGRVDSVYADLHAAIDAGVVPRRWYELQEKPPRTPPYRQWYGVILREGGAVLAGEDDLRAVAS